MRSLKTTLLWLATPFLTAMRHMGVRMPIRAHQTDERMSVLPRVSLTATNNENYSVP